MGAILVTRCPQCWGDLMSLCVVSSSASADDNEGWHVHLTCPRCYRPSCATMKCVEKGRTPLLPMSGQHVGQWRPTPPAQGDILLAGWIISAMWPEPPKPRVPEHLSEKVGKAFLQAERNFAQEGMETAAAFSYGQALELALLEKAPGTERMSAKQRIKRLADEGRITSDLASWADHVRVERNLAVHEANEITHAELTALRGFTEMVLTYLFTLPKMLAERKAAAAAGLTDPPKGEGTGYREGTEGGRDDGKQ